MDAHRIQVGNPADISPNPSLWASLITPITTLTPTRQLVLILFATILILLNAAFFRLASVLTREPICRRPPPSSQNPTHLLIVLGSGGHTAEMLNILSQYRQLALDFTHRTYVVSSGDGFSALKAHEFESLMLPELTSSASSLSTAAAARDDKVSKSYDVVTVHRARRVHQSIISAPISSLHCLWDCIAVLRCTHSDFQPQAQDDRRRRPTYPDLILTNGPGTGVIVILASIILLFFGFAGPSPSLSRSKSAPTSTTLHSQAGQMRSVFIESWARVKTLSLSGRLLKPFVDRFLVQWPQLVETEGGKVEYIGPLVT